MDISFGLRHISDAEAQAISLRGFKAVIQRLASNTLLNSRFTHNEVKVIAKASLILLPNFDFSAEDSAEIRFLLAGVASSGLTIAERAVLAKQVLMLIDYFQLQLNTVADEADIFLEGSKW